MEYFDHRMICSRYNEARAPKVFSRRQHFDRNRTVLIRLMTFDSLKTLECLGNYLRKLLDQVDFVRIQSLPEDFRLDLVLANLVSRENPCSITKTSPAMGRIINVERILERLVNGKRGAGFVLGVEDSLMPENDDSFVITHSGVARTRKNSDLRIRQSDLLALFAGSKTSLELLRENKINLHDTERTV